MFFDTIVFEKNINGVLNMYQQRFKQGFDILQKKGVRMTPQRLAILDYISSSESHPTVDKICKDLQSLLPSLTIATIYNNLKCFKKYGLINELYFGEAASRYEWVTSFHYHVICNSCGKITDFYYPKLMEVEEFAQSITGFKVTHHFFEIKGICSECK